MTELKLNLHKTLFQGIEKHTNQGCSQSVWESGIPVWVLKNHFSIFVFSVVIQQKYVEVAINDFTMHIIISKWLRRQKCRQKRKTMKQKDFEKKEEIVYESVFVYLNM